MAEIFPVLETEDIIQVGDKTRISGARSYTNSSTALTEVDIKPGKNADTVTITDSDPDNYFTDLQFPFTIDVDATNNKLDFNEGGSELTATVASAEYTLSGLASAIKTALDSAGALTYTVSVDSDTNKLTVSSTANFSLLAKTGSNADTSLYGDIGFTETDDPLTPVGVLNTVDFAGNSTYTGDEIKTVDKLITLTVKNGVDTDASTTKTIQVISELGDKLFSTDAMLRDHEPDIMRYLKAGKATFKNFHRLAQTQIFGWMDKEGMVDLFDAKYTKEHALLPEEFEQWSKFVALRLIFDGISNRIDDLFFKKARQYEKLEKFFRDRAVLRLDIDKDEKVDLNEQIDITFTTVMRR